MEARTPAQILEYTSDIGVVKVQRGKLSRLILSFFAGAFIAFASEGSTGWIFMEEIGGTAQFLCFLQT